MIDPISNARLQLINPLLARKIEQMADILAVDRPPISFRVTQGLRTWNDQGTLYAVGRTTPGDIITDAPPGHSWHNYGLAVDIAPFNVDKSIDWDTSHPVWKRLMAVGDGLGLKHVYLKTKLGLCRDWPHFQLTGRFPDSPDDEVRKVFLDAGMSALWDKAGILES